MLDERDDLFRHAVRPAAGHALLGQLAQVTCRRIAGRHDLVGIFVTQLVEREVDCLRNVYGFGEQLGRIHMCEDVERAQVAFAVRIQQETGLVDRDALANRRQRVLQDAARTAMHVYVTAGDQRQSEPATHRRQCRELFLLPAVGEQLDGDPQSVTKRLAQPVILHVEVILFVGHPENDAAGQPALESHARQLVLPFFGHAPRRRDQFAQRGIALTILCEHDELAATTE